MLDQPFEEEEQEMSFLDHLEIFRWHIIRGLIAIAIGTIIAFIFGKQVEEIIMGPANLDFWTYRQMCALSGMLGTDALCFDSLDFTIINRRIMGKLIQHLTISFLAGLILAFPYILFELWRFLKPALKKSERRYLQGVVFFGSLLFFLGVSMGYFILAPISVQFLVNYNFLNQVDNQTDLQSYLSLISMITLAAALVFQLPIVVYFLAKVGLVTPKAMRTHRKHALVAILAVSAIITPPDVMSQIFLTIPFFILYETSILIAANIQRKQRKQEAAEKAVQ